MTREDVERMRLSQGKILRIECSDGEILNARILFVDDEYQDTTYDLVSSTTPEKYKDGNASAYVVKWADIVTCSDGE